MVLVKRQIPVVVSAVAKHQGWEFVNPESCSSSPVWLYSSADCFSIKRMFGIQRKPSWFVTEVYWRNNVKHEIIYSVVRSVLRFMIIQKETQPCSGAYVTFLLCYTSASLFRIFGCLFFGNVYLRITESDSDACGVCQCALAPIPAIFSRNDEEMLHGMLHTGVPQTAFEWSRQISE